MASKKTDQPATRDRQVNLQSLVDTFPEPMIVIGEDYRIKAANDAYVETYSSGRPDILGKKCHEISHHSSLPCDMSGEECPLQEAKKGSHHARAFHIHHSLGGRVFANVEVFPVGGDEGEVLYLERIQSSSVAHPGPEMEGLVGESPAFSRMLSSIHRVAHLPSTVLLLGETGTGKELVSQAIHKLSPRASKPFVAVDCSGLPENLIESELFGHEKGAFTGAHSQKTGLVETAKGGTLFLDEIGELPLNMQAKLLRLLETNVYRRVGGIEAKKADIRLISATHRDLANMVREGTFRQDLFYRINVFPIHLPALRNRPEDIPLLAQTILGRLSATPPVIRPEAMDLLLAHDYPGNIRELKNILERALILSDQEEITPDHLPDLTENPEEFGPFFQTVVTLEAMEKKYLQWALQKTGQDLPRLAAALGISLRTLYRKIERLKADATMLQADPRSSDKTPDRYQDTGKERNLRTKPVKRTRRNPEDATKETPEPF